MNLAAVGRLVLIALMAGACLVTGFSDTATAIPYKSKQIRVEYDVPKIQRIGPSMRD